MIKVIEFVTSLGDGGAEGVAANYSMVVDKSQFCLINLLLYDTPEYATYKRVKESKTPIISIYKNRKLHNRIIRKLTGNLYVPWKINKILRKINPDVIHVHGDVLEYLVPISKQLKGIRLFYTCHSEPEKKFLGKNVVQKRAAEYLIKNNGMRLVALHEEMRVKLNEMFAVDNTLIIKNGVDRERFVLPPETRKKVRKSLNIPEDCLLLGHIGRISKVKNHSYLLDVFKEVCNRRDDAHLLLIGDGPLLENVRSKAQELKVENRITILSRRSDIPELLCAMDVFVFPSFYEGLSVALVEAQMSGLKCVISDRINHENILTSHTIPLSIDTAPEKWAEVVLDKSIITSNHGDLDQFDLRKEIKRVERIYANVSV